MNYEKQTWTTGEVITAEKLNHMEDGIKSSDDRVFIVSYNNGRLGNTWQEIYDAYTSGMTALVLWEYIDPTSGHFAYYSSITEVASMNVDAPGGDYNPSYEVRTGSTYYYTSSPNDYPQIGD